MVDPRDKIVAQRIAALAHEAPTFSNGSRALPGPDYAQAIVDEIDSTVLGARLCFRIDACELVLDAAGRRLHRVVSLRGVDLEDSECVGADLGMENEDLLTSVSDLIYAFSDSQGMLTVEDLGLGASDMDSGEGVSTNALSRVMGLDDPSLPDPDRMVARLETLADAILVLKDAAIVDTIGEKDEVDALNHIAQTQLDTFLQAQTSEAGAPTVVFLADVVAPDLGLCVVRLEEHVLLAIVENALAGYLISAFNRVV